MTSNKLERFMHLVGWFIWIKNLFILILFWRLVEQGMVWMLVKKTSIDSWYSHSHKRIFDSLYITLVALGLIRAPTVVGVSRLRVNYSVQWTTNAQLFHKLSHSSYLFRHYCAILRDFVVSTLPSNASCQMQLLVHLKFASTFIIIQFQ